MYSFFFFSSSGDHRDLHSFPNTTLFRSPRLSVARAAGDARGSHGGRVARQAYRRGGARQRRVGGRRSRSEEHTSELQSPDHLVCRLLLEKKKKPTALATLRSPRPWRKFR